MNHLIKNYTKQMNFIDERQSCKRSVPKNIKHIETQRQKEKLGITIPSQHDQFYHNHYTSHSNLNFTIEALESHNLKT